MQDRISEKFQSLKQSGEKALVGFVTAGDPDVAVSLRIIEAMCKAGLDVLELGVPFSDPTADGPVIQRSSARALAEGVTLSRVLEMTADIRKFTDIPVILFSYYNPILQYGGGRFYDDSIAAGADGVLVVDLPPEESGELTNLWGEKPFSFIRLVAPTTPDSRRAEIAECASGFLYMISKTGVTGSSGLQTDVVRENVEGLRSVTDIPICAGFGISTVADVEAVGRVADGVVIGSAFERIIEENLDDREMLLQTIAARTRDYKGGLAAP